MVNKSEKRIKEWLKEGKWNFILKRGILHWGLLYSMIMYFFTVGFVFDLGALIMWLIIGALFGGGAFGYAMWWYYSRKFGKK